jgi:hypothetical protein
MKLWIGIGMGLLLSACSVVPSDIGSERVDIPAGNEPEGNQIVVAQLEDLGPAPELENEIWLNVDEPLRLANLRGQVVLLDMWTFG